MTYMDYLSVSRTMGRGRIVPSRLILVCLLLSFCIVSRPQLRAQTVYEANANVNAIEGTADVESCSGCLDGERVGNIGDGNANYLRIKNISVPASGLYSVQLFYTMGTDGGSRNLTLQINDGTDPASNPTLTGLTGTNWLAPAPPILITALLTAGNGNSIGFFNPTALAPDIDHIVVSASPIGGSGGSTQPPGGSGNSTGDGSSGFVAPSDIAEFLANDYVPQGYCQANIPLITLSYCSFYYYDRVTKSDSAKYGEWDGSFTTGGWSSSYPIQSVPNWCFPFLYCYYQPAYVEYSAQSSLTMTVPKPAVSDVSSSGITFWLRQYSVSHKDQNGNPINGDVVTALGTSGSPLFSITEIGNRWGLHSYQSLTGPGSSTKGFDVTYWEPYTYSGNVNIYEDVYYTFSPDGRLRIDKFTPVLTGGVTQYIWEEALSDTGWPATWNSDGTRTFAELGGIAVGGSSGRANNVDGFGELSVFKTALSTPQMIEMENSRNANSTLTASMLPCNTGQWVDPWPVQTPCGSGGNQVPIPLPPTNIAGYTPANLSLAPQNVAFSASGGGYGYSFGEVASYPPLSEIQDPSQPAPWPNFYPVIPLSYTIYLAIEQSDGVHLCQEDLGKGSSPPPSGVVLEGAIGANYPLASLNGPDTIATTPWQNPLPQNYTGGPAGPTGAWTCTTGQFN